MPLPGMAAIALWMLAVSLLGVSGVLKHHYPTSVLALCTVLAVGGLGLIRLQRWGWALALGAAFLSMCFAAYNLFRFKQPQWAVMGVVNLVFFLYLVRTEVIERLR